MKATSVALFALASSVAIAAPLNIKRSGPSGSLSTPFGGFNIPSGSPLQIVYQPVNSQGQTTLKIDVELIDLSTGGSNDFPLAYGLSADTTGDNIQAWFNDIGSFNAGGPTKPCGSYGVRITEYQSGPVFTGSFQAAQPQVNFQC